MVHRVKSQLFRAIGMVMAGSVLACGGNVTGVQVTAERTFADHREIDVTFTSEDVRLTGTLYVPLGAGPFDAVVLNQGSSWTTRATWEQVAPFTPVAGAVFSYDRRGHGQSEGACCEPDDAVGFELLAADAVAAVRAVRALDQVNPALVGLWGSSRSGWIVPLAANRAPADIAFVIVAVGGAVSVGQELLYDDLTGYAQCNPSGRTDSAVTDMLVAAGPSGFDPLPSLETLAQPTLWLFGGRDLSHPTTLAVRNLEDIQSRSPKPWTITVFPNANHDFIENGTICQTDGPLANVGPVIAQFHGSLQ